MYSVPIFSILLLILFTRKIPEMLENRNLILLMMVSPILLTNIFAVTDDRIPGDVLLETNFNQINDSLIISAGLLTALLICALLFKKKYYTIIISYSVVFIVLCLPIMHIFTLSWRFYHNPETGHEYVDNTAIADALKAIPIQNSIIVTNDFRYPADNYKRDLRQMQIPALFGHQCYACNFKYQIYEESSRRLKQQRLLSLSNWQSRLGRVAINNDWTHLLIHKKYLHPSNIPYSVLKENDQYIVYDLKTVDLSQE
jgi:hypothetical protein